MLLGMLLSGQLSHADSTGSQILPTELEEYWRVVDSQSYDQNYVRAVELELKFNATPNFAEIVATQFELAPRYRRGSLLALVLGHERTMEQRLLIRPWLRNMLSDFAQLAPESIGRKDIGVLNLAIRLYYDVSDSNLLEQSDMVLLSRLLNVSVDSGLALTEIIKIAGRVAAITNSDILRQKLRTRLEEVEELVKEPLYRQDKSYITKLLKENIAVAEGRSEATPMPPTFRFLSACDHPYNTLLVRLAETKKGIHSMPLEQRQARVLKVIELVEAFRATSEREYSGLNLAIVSASTQTDPPNVTLN